MMEDKFLITGDFMFDEMLHVAIWWSTHVSIGQWPRGISCFLLIGMLGFLIFAIVFFWSIYTLKVLTLVLHSPQLQIAGALLYLNISNCNKYCGHFTKLSTMANFHVFENSSHMWFWSAAASVSSLPGATARPAIAYTRDPLEIPYPFHRLAEIASCKWPHCHFIHLLYFKHNVQLTLSSPSYISCSCVSMIASFAKHKSTSFSGNSSLTNISLFLSSQTALKNFIYFYLLAIILTL